MLILALPLREVLNVTEPKIFQEPSFVALKTTAGRFYLIAVTKLLPLVEQNLHRKQIYHFLALQWA